MFTREEQILFKGGLVWFLFCFTAKLQVVAWSGTILKPVCWGSWGVKF